MHAVPFCIERGRGRKFFSGRLHEPAVQQAMGPIGSRTNAQILGSAGRVDSYMGGERHASGLHPSLRSKIRDGHVAPALFFYFDLDFWRTDKL